MLEADKPADDILGEFTSFDELDGEDPDDEDESKVDIDDEDLHDHE